VNERATMIAIPDTSWAKIIIGTGIYLASILAHAFLVTLVAGWKLGYNFRKMREVSKLAHKHEDEIIRINRQLAAVTGVANGVKYRRD